MQLNPIDSWMRTQQWYQNRKIRRKMDRHREAYDVFLVSVPKCGRTWHRVLLGHYLAKLTGTDVRSAPNVKDLSKAAPGLKTMTYTHNGSSPNDGFPPLHKLVANPREWRGKHVILVVRDPRDIMVSAYFHEARRKSVFAGTISEFLRAPTTGIDKVATAWSRWHQYRHLAATFSVISYEEMHRNPHEMLRKTLRVLGAATIDETLVSASVQFASFDNMKKMEGTGYFAAKGLKNNSGDPDGAKVRKGKVGSYRDFLSSDDIAHIEAVISAIGDPFGTLTARQP